MDFNVLERRKRQKERKREREKERRKEDSTASSELLIEGKEIARKLKVRNHQVLPNLP